ncbi:uncharacterized protein [Temnothorax nylanderi]|uniref:uncharacterized protein n=1 Tax=Temnothorax nylanderi TaxID=102681 RepID=UPI003A8A74D9
MASLEKLVKRRAYVKGQVTKISRWAAAYSTTTNRASEIEAMLNALDRYRIDFKELQDQIEECPEALFDEQQRERAEFQDNLIKVEAHIREIQTLAMAAGHASQRAIRPDSRASVASTDASAYATIKLPEIKLTPFDDEWENWLSFKNVFTELIHNNPQLTDAQRFYYLQSYVIAGSAKQYIDLPITAENYAIAWKQLRDHFDNESRIVKKHVKGLYELKKSQEDSAQSGFERLRSSMKNFHALKALNQPVDNWDALLSHLVLTKLDLKSRGEVEKAAPSNRLQTFRELMKVLADRVRILEAVSPAESSKMKMKPDKSSKSLVAMGAAQCPICKNEHFAFKCKSFLDMSPQQRVEAVRKHSLCFNCLASSHIKQDCKSGNCRICHKRHHTLLHLKSTVDTNQSNQQASQGTASSSESTALNIVQEVSTQAEKACSLHVNSESKTEQVLLASAIVIIYDSCGRECVARALLDGCSQFSFMTERLRQRLQLKGKREHFKVTGINCTKTATHTSVNATIKSRTSDFKVSSEFLVTDKITGDLPQQALNMAVMQIPSYVKLADPHFHVPNKIDILIGADMFWDLLTGEILSTHPEQPKLHGTHLGFVVGGKVTHLRRPQSAVSLTCVMDNLEEQVHKFWQQEELPKRALLSQEKLECEQHYQKHTRRESDGQYVVALPLKSNVQDLSDTRDAALRQFLRLEQRLQRDPKVWQMYQAFMEEYIDLKHAEIVPDDYSGESLEFYMPHHHVLRPESSTTKLRVVFNASFRVNPKLSLNDVLMVGPTIQTDLFSLVLRFRKHIYGLTADMSKMYRQIKVHKNQRPLQTIWWRDRKTGKVIRCWLMTVTYGTGPATFLATRSLKQLAHDEQASFPVTVLVLLEDTYIDHVISGASTKEEVITLQSELTQLMKRGGIDLHKWATNCKDVSFTQCDVVDLTKTDRKQVLGLIWETQSDQFVIPWNTTTQQETHTKRKLLSEIMKLYDPLGICAPVIFKAKCILQELWKVPNLHWDDELPSSIQQKWNEFRNQIPGEIKVPRCIQDQSSVWFELHGFGDASELGYGCCLYIRAITNDKRKTDSLLCAKSRVAPLKKATIPRLELLAALLLAELKEKAILAMKIQFQKITLWTDSKITLYRIKSTPSRFATFVANRIV